MTCPAHHWLLESPQPEVPTVSGTCKHCGATREFDAFGPTFVGGSWRTMTLVPEKQKGQPRRTGPAA